MSRTKRLVPYKLDSSGVQNLPLAEIAAILRAADPLIALGGRTLLRSVLKGSREKRLLEIGLSSNPSYGFFRSLPVDEVKARVDWMIEHDYLDITYRGRLPLLVFTPAGWEIERETVASELLARLDAMLSAGTEDDMTFLKDRDRGLVLLLLDKIEAAADPRYIPVLMAWAEIDYQKVVRRIRQVIASLEAPHTRL